MAPTLEALGIDRLAPEEQLDIAEAIWERVASQMEREPMPESHRAELQRRLADSIARPEAVVPWEEVKARLMARGKR